jgi:hypothetical protein
MASPLHFCYSFCRKKLEPGLPRFSLEKIQKLRSTLFRLPLRFIRRAQQIGFLLEDIRAFFKVSSGNGNLRTLSPRESSQSSEFTTFKTLVLAPNVVSGEVNAPGSRRRKTRSNRCRLSVSFEHDENEI